MSSHELGLCTFVAIFSRFYIRNLSLQVFFFLKHVWEKGDEEAGNISRSLYGKIRKKDIEALTQDGLPKALEFNFPAPLNPFSNNTELKR